MITSWSELCADKTLQNLPYRVETNHQGQVIMTPHKPIHSRFQSMISRLLEERLSEGVTLVECPIRTQDGTKVVDVAWCSNARWSGIKQQAEASVAPEICVEVMSEANTESEMVTKRSLYFSAGAKEVWIVDTAAQIQFFDEQGERSASGFCDFPAQISDT